MKSDNYSQVKETIEKSIIKSDGTYKRVLLYNLCTASLLKDGETLISKLERNLAVFEENENDIFVIFSVQAGIEDKLSLVRENVLEPYRVVLKKYEDADFCMVVTPDEMEQLYDLCDAFYGDWGIGAWRCRQMEKPVMIQNAEVE